MTTKLKYPFCQQELRNCCAGVIYTCSKPDSCPHEQCYGSKELWQALIQAKQDLEIATKALEKYADEDMWENCCIWDIEYIQGLFLEHGYKIAKEALEQISRKED